MSLRPGTNPFRNLYIRTGARIVRALPNSVQWPVATGLSYAWNHPSNVGSVASGAAAIAVPLGKRGYSALRNQFGYSPARQRGAGSRRSGLARSMPHRRFTYGTRRPRRRAYRKRRRSNFAPSSRGISASIKRGERVQRGRINYKPSFCRSITQLPPRCRDKFVCTTIFDFNTVPQHSDLVLSTAAPAGNTIRVVAGFQPFQHLNQYAATPGSPANSAGVLAQEYAGWDIMANHFKRYICHGFKVKITLMKIMINGGTSTDLVRQLRLVGWPIRGGSASTVLSAHDVNQWCDAPATTSITCQVSKKTAGNQDGIMGPSMIAVGATTAAIFGVARSAIQDADEDAFNGDTLTGVGSAKQLEFVFGCSGHDLIGGEWDTVRAFIEVEGDFEFYEQKKVAAWTD